MKKIIVILLMFLFIIPLLGCSSNNNYSNNAGTEIDNKDEGETCDIKGNISYYTDEKIYHVPGGEYYNKTEIDQSEGERWFCSEEEARAAGWRKSKR